MHTTDTCKILWLWQFQPEKSNIYSEENLGGNRECCTSNEISVIGNQGHENPECGAANKERKDSERLKRSENLMERRKTLNDKSCPFDAINNGN